jgi:MFS family permease
MQITLWSIVAASQVAMSGKASFYTCRALIGALEGGFIPDLILWMSYFYKGSELTLRLSWFWISRYLTMVVTSVMAYGLLRMRGIHGLEGWRWLFLIEGLITFAIGIASFFLMPASATQTKTWFRPKGWFTEREVGIVVNRVLRDDPGKGDMNNRAGLSIGDLWDACIDFDLWPASTIVAYRKGQALTKSSALLDRRRLHDTAKHARPIHYVDASLIGIRSGGCGTIRPH